MLNLDGCALIVFDKDGTLIDFDAMWGSWVETLAARLAAVTGLNLAGRLYADMGYDAIARKTLAGGKLAVMPMADLADLTLQLLGSYDLPDHAARAALADSWVVPHPSELARPITDLPALFASLRAAGHKLAIVTSDDRPPTEATLQALGVADMLDSVWCADDGLPVKPAPHALLAACRAAGAAPGETIMVGDTLADLAMARAAGAMAVGVASGVSSAALLAPHADIVLDSVADLIRTGQ